MTETNNDTPPSPPLPRPHTLRRRFDPVLVAGFLFLALSITVGVVGYSTSHDSFDLRLLLTDYYANLSTELGSIAVVIIVVDRLNKRQDRRNREEARLKHQILHDLRTENLADARKALAVLIQRDWLWDGSLQDANFARANLRGAVLSITQVPTGFSLRRSETLHAALRGADMRRCDLRNAVLSGADLRDTNLKHALLADADLTGIICNENTILPDDTLWQPGEDFRRFTDPTQPNFWQPHA